MAICVTKKFIKVRIADGTFYNNGFQSVKNKPKNKVSLPFADGPYYQAAFLGFTVTNRMNMLLYRPSAFGGLEV